MFVYSENDDGQRVNEGSEGKAILINSNPKGPFASGYNGFEGLNDRQNRALTMIHELGHYVAGNFGADATKVGNDDESDPTHTTTSKKNSDLVKANCF